MEVNLGGGEVGSWQRGSKSLAREEEAWSLIAARIAKKNLQKIGTAKIRRAKTRKTNQEKKRLGH